MIITTTSATTLSDATPSQSTFLRTFPYLSVNVANGEIKFPRRGLGAHHLRVPVVELFPLDFTGELLP